mgnify:CR=1 FL=1
MVGFKIALDKTCSADVKQPCGNIHDFYRSHFYFRITCTKRTCFVKLIRYLAPQSSKKSGIDREADKVDASARYELNDYLSAASAVVNLDAGSLQAMQAAIEIYLKVLTTKN